MILGPVSLIDCIVFCIFLAPQLVIHVGFFRTTFVALKALPFLLVRMPLSLLHERYVLPRALRSPFCARATLFEDLVVRCVRYAFAAIPANVGRVFFSKAVSLPFMRWRMLRHGYLRSPVTWREHVQEGPDGFRGIWISADPSKPPDMVLYYVHGGGFSMGSAHFYLEFLLAWHSLLVEAGYKNPAIFALEYPLVPDRKYPTQVYETLRGYRHVLTSVGDPSKVVVSGDSAGGTLVLTMLLQLGELIDARDRKKKMERNAAAAAAMAESPPRSNGVANGSTGNGEVTERQKCRYWASASETPLPAFGVLISPWMTLVSTRHHNTPSDFLDKGQLHEYAMQYAGTANVVNSTASPGLCDDVQLWKRASPTNGFFVTYGTEEVFAPDIKEFMEQIEHTVAVDGRSEPGGIHAWPVASLFLASTEETRLKGLRQLTRAIRNRI